MKSVQSLGLQTCPPLGTVTSKIKLVELHTVKKGQLLTPQFTLTLAIHRFSYELASCELSTERLFCQIK